MKENGTEVNMLLAGDIGGTKTLLGLYEAGGRGGRCHPAGPPARRPRQVAVRSFSTCDYADLATIITTFTEDASVRGASLDSAAFGVAGPVMGGVAQLTNVPWRVEASGVADRFGIRRVVLLNDLQAMACGVPALEESELHALQAGEATEGGNMAV